MRKRRVLPVVAAVAVGGAVLIATSASASPSEAGASAHRGAVHFSSFTDNDGPSASVILTGALGDFGESVSVNPDGSVSTGHAGQMKLVLSQGSFRIDFGALDQQLLAAIGAHPMDTRSCAGHVTTTGTAVVVPGSGDGAYRGIAGTFHLTVTLDELVARNQCDWTGATLRQSIVVLGSGELSLAG
ncbi:hypothetical protein ABH931_005763 [Streptacidiphilus sp. MAP12-33]|uniref:hypothetical protein n=1 Tax=Streptacidiphilus sp. MAP12-33 TaxID=3156266 RepID=UPI0035158899